MKICPYLGLLDDPQTPAIFPSERNCCYRSDPAQAILNLHQQEYCLSSAHPTCPVFIDPAAGNTFLHPQRASGRSGAIFPFGLAFLVLLFAALGVWYYREALFGAGPAAQPEIPAAPAPALRTEEPQAAFTLSAPGPLATLLVVPTAIPSATFSPPPPSETASVTPPSSLGTPIGADPALVVHRVSAGESLVAIATRYGTSEAAIRAVNLMLPVPLWENWLVVVPFQTEAVADLPLFEVYQVSAEGVALALLAQQLNADPILLAQYNQLEEDGYFANGQWVLVPHTRR
ncbi:MAG: LysM domain-containing protein [Anaerolineales bacterium]|jgi:hypothetical protein|nr:LysM domain-containing protein [Anaerolineales bacterium]